MSATFDVAFQKDILARAITDPGYRIQAARIVAAEHFDSKEMEWCWRQLTILPAGEVWSEKLCATHIRRDFTDKDKQREHLLVAKDLFRREVPHAKASLDELRRFVTYHQLSAGIERAIKGLEKGDVDAAESALYKAARSSSDTAYEEGDWIGGMEARMAARRKRAEEPDTYYKVPIGLNKMDEHLKGGLTRGDMLIFAGLTGVGKSHAAINAAVSSALREFNTLLIDTENGLDLTFDRLDAKFIGAASDRIAIYDLTAAELERMADKLARQKLRLERKLKVIHVSPRKATIHTVEQALDDMAIEGREAQFLIVDCADHIKPITSNKEFRLETANTYWDLKGIADERHIPLVVTSQLSKEALGRIATAEQLSEAYDKARIASHVVTLNQTTRERMDDRMRWFLAKYRGGRGGRMFPLRCDLSRSHFEYDESADRAVDDEEDDD